MAVIDKMYPLDQAAEARKYVDTGQKNGNVVLTVGGFQESCRLKLKIMPPCPSPFQCFVCPG